MAVTNLNHLTGRDRSSSLGAGCATETMLLLCLKLYPNIAVDQAVCEGWQVRQSCSPSSSRFRSLLFLHRRSSCGRGINLPLLPGESNLAS